MLYVSVAVGVWSVLVSGIDSPGVSVPQPSWSSILRHRGRMEMSEQLHCQLESLEVMSATLITFHLT